MIEDSIFENISQEVSTPSADSEFDYIWNNLAKSDNSLWMIDNTLDVGTTLTNEVNVENLASGSGIQILNNENEAEIGQIEALSDSIQIELPISAVNASLQYAPSSLPASQTWPGDYEFRVSFSDQNKDTKGIAWTYSKIKDKLYVKKDAPCPVNFSANNVLPSGVCIRVMVLYTLPEQVSEVVHRCHNHSMDELRNNVYEAQHLVRCVSTRANYQIDSTTKHHSVTVPFENPPAGEQFSTYIFKFMCFGSCAGGPNRRPMMLVFILEWRNRVIGRHKLNVKICACPGRDRKIEESQYMEADNARPEAMKRKANDELESQPDTSRSASHQLPKTKDVTSSDEPYNIKVKSKGCADFLLQMKNLFELGISKIETTVSQERNRSDDSD